MMFFVKQIKIKSVNQFSLPVRNLPPVDCCRLIEVIKLSQSMTKIHVYLWTSNRM